MASHRGLKAGTFIFEFDTPGIGYILKHAGLRVHGARHRAQRLRHRDRQKGHDLRESRRAAHHRAEPVPRLQGHRAHPRRGRRRRHAADGEQRGRGEVHHPVHEVRPHRRARRGPALGSGLLHDRTHHGEAGGAEPSHHARRADRNRRGGRERRGDRRARGGGLPLGRSLRPDLFARHPRRIRASPLRRSHRRRGRGRTRHRYLAGAPGARRRYRRRPL